MEAIAKHDFNATAEDELSFRKGQILKVTCFPSFFCIMYFREHCFLCYYYNLIGLFLADIKYGRFRLVQSRT